MIASDGPTSPDEFSDKSSDKSFDKFLDKKTPPPKRRRRWRRNLLFVFWLLVITVVLLEVVVRVSGYAEHYIYDPIYTPFEGSEEIPFVHKPHLTGVRGRGLTNVSTDRLGLRCSESDIPPASKPSKEVRIAVLGDSVTFGEGVPNNDDTFCRVLQTARNSADGKKHYHVFNFGVSAYSVKEMYATLVHRVAPVQPDVVLLAIVPDDFHLTRTPQVDAYGYTYNAELSGYLSRDSLLKRMLRNVRSVYFLRDLLHQWRHRNDVPSDIEPPLPKSYRYVVQFHEEADRRGWKNAVVLLPSRLSSFPKALRKRMRTDGVPVIDLTGIAEQFNDADFHASRFDRHPSAKAHRAIGNALAKSLRAF